ncbi:MAG: FGGY family carbohydrate kinase [Actinoplanes sp.]
MNARPTLLGVDLGTSSVKVVLTDPSGRILDQTSEAYPVRRPYPGWAETDPQAWWDALVSAVARLDTAFGQIAGVGLSGQMHGVVLCTADTTPVRPAVLWSDTRSEAELDLYQRLPAPVQARLGNPITAGMAGPHLAWLRRNEPDVLDRARWALQPKDWIRARLTGHVAAEPSDASGTLLYDVSTQDWNATVIDALEIRHSLLAPILPHSGVAAGTLTPTAAADLGLPAGLPVAAGAADTAAAALGTGLLVPGRTQLTIGTGVQIVRIVTGPGTPDAASSSTAPRPSASSHAEAPVTHLCRDSTPHGWYAMAASLTGGHTLDWVRHLLGATWTELYAAADRQPQTSDPIFVPHLVGERTPYLDSRLRGSWTGLAANHTRNDLLYAAVEGVAFATADAFDALPGSDTVDGLLLAGGGTTAPPLRALLADVLRQPLDAADVPGASARGAGLLAAIATGLTAFDDVKAAGTPAATRVAAPTARSVVLVLRRTRYHHVLGQLAGRG